MEINTDTLSALTHLDGRNYHKTFSLRKYFSEVSWHKYRLLIMESYLEFLINENIIKVNISSSKLIKLKKFITDFSLNEAIKVAQIEKITNHDLKALENYLAKVLEKSQLEQLIPFINLGIGSEDINNIALRQQMKQVYREELRPQIKDLLESLIRFAKPLLKTPMLGKTHGQPASTTTIGKEIALFIYQIHESVKKIDEIKFKPKFSGEVGNFNALKILNPKINWLNFENKFLQKLGFSKNSPATQIAPYIDLINFFDNLKNLNSAIIGLGNDIWSYGSFGYLAFKNPSQEIGSAGMPHKINPQYFEGTIGGLEIANANLEFFSRKLAINKLQRDFSDSTVRRNIVFPITYSFLSYQSLLTGLDRLEINASKIQSDLNDHWEILSETLKTLLKSQGESNAYDLIKKHVKGQNLDKESYLKIIDQLPFDKKNLNIIKKLAPQDLIGESYAIGNKIIQDASNYLKKKYEQ